MKNSQTTQDPPGRTAAPSRQEKLARALRANLKKRKAQTRARSRTVDDGSRKPGA